MKTYTKIFLLLFVLMTTFTACQYGLEADQELLIKSEESIGDLAEFDLRLEEKELPKMKFSVAGKNDQNTRLRLVEPLTEDLSSLKKITASVKPRKRPDLLVQEWDALIDEQLSMVQENPLLKASFVFTTQFKETFAQDIVAVDLQYTDADGNKLKSQNFDVFVFEDGSTDLQDPKIGDFAILIDENSADKSQLLLNVSDDPAKEVASVKVEIAGIDDPNFKGSYTLSRRGELDHVGAYNFMVEIAGLNAGPYTTTLTMISATGEVIVKTKLTEVQALKADFTGRVRRIRIRENNSGTNFRTIVVLTGDTNNQVASVETKFSNGDDPTIEPWTVAAEFISYDEATQTSRYAVEGELDRLSAYTTVSARMKAIDGTNLGGTFSDQIVLEKGRGRVHRIRIRENQGDTSFRIIVDENTDPDDEEAAFVQVQFLETFGNPAPIPPTAILALKQSLPEKNRNRYVYTPLTFEGGASPAGEVYNVGITFLKADGTPIGDVVTRDVIVEMKDDEDAV